MRKAISLVLVFSILLLSGSVYAQERKGANIEIYKTTTKIEIKMEGTPWGRHNIEPDIRGELIAVKQNSLLLLDRESGADVTVDVGDVSVITIVKKGGKGFQIGYWIGFGVVGTFGLLYPASVEMSVLVALFGGLATGLLGAIISGLLSKDKTIQLEGMTDSEIKEILEKLRKKARIRNSQ